MTNPSSAIARWTSNAAPGRRERDFNEYVGAGVLGGTSHLYHLTATDHLRPLVAGRYDGPLYTAEPSAARSASIGARRSA